MSFIHYEDLDVYKLAYRLTLEIHKASLELPKIEQFSGLADQMRRASRSVCANMAEGFSKYSSVTEEKRFLSISRGSCDEMRFWAKLGADLNYWPSETADTWRASYTQISKMLYSLMEKRKAA